MKDAIGYNLESEIGHTWNGDVLHSVTKQILKKNDEIISETITEHFKADLSDFREYLSIKGNGGYLYLCCDENYHSCGSENGAISDIQIKKTAQEAFEWFLDRLKKASENKELVLDLENEDYRCFSTRMDMVRNRFFGEIEEFDRTSIIVFIGHQENWECHYEIVARRIKVF